MCPAPLSSLKPGQLFYDTQHEQNAVVLGHNGIGWLFQYEDGDIVELGGPTYPNYLSDQMVYMPASREVERRRPTLDKACHPAEHVFFADPTTPHERDDESVRCAICGLEREVLIDDLGQPFDFINILTRGKCQHCKKEIPPGEPEHASHTDFYTCTDCHDEVKDMSWAEYTAEFGPLYQ
ncbi:MULTISPECIES: hypothetical protein [Haloferacaceae]|uniref:Uncharacterized protein n=2 Tax=Haloferacaceae TaxID=1644056 RepID=A0ABD6DAL9_9EURY|nr:MULTISPECIES: hypothetical protein [Halorubraceae]